MLFSFNLGVAWIWTGMPRPKRVIFGAERVVTGRGIPDKGTRTNPLARTTNYGD